MLRSRVTTGIDVNRLANAVARPGIDPRVWVSYAVLTSEPVVELREGQQDVIVDLLLLPSGQPETARVGAMYAGNGFGLYAPLHKDDEVLVVAPSGDPDEGLVVMQRLWSPADPPPSAVTENPLDVTLVVENGRSLRLNVAGGGKVYIGGSDGSKAVAHVDSEVAASGTIPSIPPVPANGMVGWMTVVTSAINTLLPGTLPYVPTTLGTVSTGSAVAEVQP